LQHFRLFSCTKWSVFVAKIQKINLIGWYLLLKSVNFFVFSFQNLNIQTGFEPLW